MANSTKRSRKYRSKKNKNTKNSLSKNRAAKAKFEREFDGDRRSFWKDEDEDEV